MGTLTATPTILSTNVQIDIQGPTLPGGQRATLADAQFMDCVRTAFGTPPSDVGLTEPLQMVFPIVVHRGNAGWLELE